MAKHSSVSTDGLTDEKIIYNAEVYPSVASVDFSVATNLMMYTYQQPT